MRRELWETCCWWEHKDKSAATAWSRSFTHSTMERTADRRSILNSLSWKDLWSTQISHLKIQNKFKTEVETPRKETKKHHKEKDERRRRCVVAPSSIIISILSILVVTFIVWKLRLDSRHWSSHCVKKRRRRYLSSILVVHLLQLCYFAAENEEKNAKVTGTGHYAENCG